MNNFSKNPEINARRAEVLMLHRQGLQRRDIAQRLGVSESMITNDFRALDLILKPKKLRQPATFNGGWRERAAAMLEVDPDFFVDCQPTNAAGRELLERMRR